MRTWRHCQLTKQVSQRGGKQSGIKHVGWALQGGMDMESCHSFWILTIFLSLRMVLLSGDSLSRETLNPIWEKKRNQKANFVSRVLQVTDHLSFVNDQGKKSMSLYQKSVIFTIQITPGLDLGWLMLSKTWCKLYMNSSKVYPQMQITPTIFVSTVILGFQYCKSECTLLESEPNFILLLLSFYLRLHMGEIILWVPPLQF